MGHYKLVVIQVKRWEWRMEDEKLQAWTARMKQLQKLVVPVAVTDDAGRVVPWLWGRKKWEKGARNITAWWTEVQEACAES